MASSDFAGDRVLDLDGSDAAPSPASEPTTERTAEPTPKPTAGPTPEPAPEPTNVPAPPRTSDDALNAELRAIKHFLDAAIVALDTKNKQHHAFRDQLAELRTEQDRLGALEGAEPGDVERLGQLVGIDFPARKGQRDEIRLPATDAREQRRAFVERGSHGFAANRLFACST